MRVNKATYQLMAVDCFDFVKPGVWPSWVHRFEQFCETERKGRRGASWCSDLYDGQVIRQRTFYALLD